MHRLIKRLYIIVLFVFITIGFVLIYQQGYYNRSIQNEMESKIDLKLDYMNSIINNYFDESVAVIESVEILMRHEKDEIIIRNFLRDKLDQSTSFKSLYIGTPENHMINGSGWEPEESFDLRNRPWYIKAVKQKKLITTSIYLNASQDDWIVTFAKPVYDESGQLTAIIGMDSSLGSIVELFKSQTFSENGCAFFLDYDGNMIMHSSIEYVTATEENEQLVMDQLNAEIDGISHGFSFSEINGKEGYISWKRIDKTGWTIGNHVPYSEFEDLEKTAGNIFLATILAALTIMLLLFYLEKSFIVRPLKAFSDDVNEISLRQNISYRLPVIKEDPFQNLREITNKILDKAEALFKAMNETRDKLEASNKRNYAIIEAIPDMFFLFDANGVFQECRVGETEKDLYIEKEHFIGNKIVDVMPNDIAQKALESIRTTIETNQMQMLEYSLPVPSGVNYFEARFMKITDAEVMAIIRNITEAKENLKEIEKLSYHDQLTNLYNRRFYLAELDRLDNKRNLPLTLVVVDVNGLKLLNDAFGHVSGDELLIRVADAIKKQCRVSEIIARIGGDEFVILLPNTTWENTGVIVDRIRSELDQLSIRGLPVSVSIGWETKVNVEETVEEIYNKAEGKMYREKIVKSQKLKKELIHKVYNTLVSNSESIRNHSERVSKISRQIAKSMNLSEASVVEAEMAGRYHDIGKIVVDPSVLNKEGELTEKELMELKKHPESSYQLLKQVDAYAKLAEHALSHHEKWDGSGYPRGLKGEDISQISRIIAVAEAYEAMTGHEPFKKTIEHEMAIEEIKRYSGTRYDPLVVQKFLEVCERRV